MGEGCATAGREGEGLSQVVLVGENDWPSTLW